LWGERTVPEAPPRVCTWPGCHVLVRDGSRCTKHKRARWRDIDRRRGSSAERGYGAKWRKAAKGFLDLNPLCRMCLERGVIRAASVVDHIIPHKGDQRLFWDRGNWQALCETDHNKKTATEDGGFGRK